MLHCQVIKGTPVLPECLRELSPLLTIHTWDTPPGEEPRAAGLLAGGVGHPEWGPKRGQRPCRSWGSPWLRDRAHAAVDGGSGGRSDRWGCDCYFGKEWEHLSRGPCFVGGSVKWSRGPTAAGRRVQAGAPCGSWTAPRSGSSLLATTFVACSVIVDRRPSVCLSLLPAGAMLAFVRKGRWRDIAGGEGMASCFWDVP